MFSCPSEASRWLAQSRCQVQTVAQDVRTGVRAVRRSAKSGWRGERLSDVTKKTSPYTPRRKWCFLLTSISSISWVHRWTDWTGQSEHRHRARGLRDELPRASRQLALSWACWREAKPLWGLSWKPIVSQHRTRTEKFKIRAILVLEASCCRWPRPGALWAQRHRDDQSLSSVPW